MRRSAIPTWVPLVIFGGATGIILWRLLLGEVLYWGLPALEYYPWRQFAFNEIRQGRLPYWNPYLGGGTPLMANYQSAVFYPPNWLHLAIPSAQAMTVLAFGHLFWAGLGMWYLTRNLGLASVGRGVSVLCFALGNYSLTQLGEFTLANTLAWLPWVFWATHSLLNRRQLRFVGVLGLMVGLQLLAGHLQTAWYTYIAIGLFTLWYIFFPMRYLGRTEQIIGFVFVGLGLLIGTGIASTQLMLTLELLWHSHRAGGVEYAVLTEQSFAPGRLLTLIAPKLFGSPSNGSYLLDTSDHGYAVITPYIGILPLLSVIFALRGWWQRRILLTRLETFESVPFWAGLSVLGIVLALGRYTPVYRLLYDIVPTFDGFRGPGRWLVLPTFALSVLAGIGAHYWESHPIPPKMVQRIGVGALGITFALGIFIGLTLQDQAIFLPMLYSLIVLGLWFSVALVLAQKKSTTSLGRWQITLLVCIAIDLAWASWGNIPTAPREFYERDLSIERPQGRLYWDEDYARLTQNKFFDLKNFSTARNRWAELRTSLLPNLNTLDRVSSFNNLDPLQPSIHREYVELIENSTARNPNNLDQLLYAAGIGEVYAQRRPPTWQGELGDFVAPLVPPSAWMVRDVRWLGDNPVAAAYMQSPRWVASQTVVIDENLPYPSGYKSLPVYTETQVEVIYERPTERSYRVQSDGMGYLVVSNTWYPGWTATVNGDSTKVYRANIAFQAIEIPEGDVVVTLNYHPTGIEVGFILSLVAVFGALLIIAVDLFRSGY